MKKVVQLTKRSVRIKELREDNIALKLSDMTPDEAEKWVDKEIVDLDSVKDMLKKITKVLVCLVKE